MAPLPQRHVSPPFDRSVICPVVRSHPSHMWSSGQDQCALIKRQLQLLLPGVKVFLDVDDRESQPEDPHSPAFINQAIPSYPGIPYRACFAVLVHAVDDVSRLEEYVSVSQCILIFLSKGLFFSARCSRELHAATALRKPLCLVHEADLNHGGSSLASLREDCPESMRALVFGLEHEDGQWRDREVITWLHTAAFQIVSLRMIAKTMLWSTPLYRESTPPVYIGEELGFKELVFPRPVVLYASASNPGAAEVATEILNRFDDANVSITLRRPPILQGSSALLNGSESPSIVHNIVPSADSTRAQGTAGQLDAGAQGPSAQHSLCNANLGSSGELKEDSLSEQSPHQGGVVRRTTSDLVRSLNAPTSADGGASVEEGLTEDDDALVPDERELRRTTSSLLVTALRQRRSQLGHATTWAVDQVDSIRQRLKGSPGEATHMLLYLNASTFTHQMGSRLAREVRAARRANLPIVVVHENDVNFGGTDFDKYARPTLAPTTSRA